MSFAEVARWIRSADRALALASEHIKLIRAVTPTNADRELAELEQAFRRGSPRLPRWTYETTGVSPELRVALEKLATFLEGISPLGGVYAARARELCLEAAIIDAVGMPSLRAPAEQRFVARDEEGVRDLARADELAEFWVNAERAPNDDEPRILSGDTSDPRSLFSRMASEAGRARLPMRTVLQPGLASLAATGDGVILVAPDRRVALRDIERTVLHEIAGHALPRARAAEFAVGIFAIGTARGVDDQEGRALLIEEAAGFLDAARRRELGLRHLAARATLAGANLIEIVSLLTSRGSSLETAPRIAARVQRGASGSGGGLAREIVYLPAFLRVGRARSGPFAAVTERMMERGRIAADVAPLVSTAAAALGPADVEDSPGSPLDGASG